jgi:hypothetical protein
MNTVRLAIFTGTSLVLQTLAYAQARGWLGDSRSLDQGESQDTISNGGKYEETHALNDAGWLISSM